MSVTQLCTAGVMVALLNAGALVAHAQPGPATVDTTTIGPQVGSVVPSLSGTDQFGKPQTLASLSGPKGLMLVFSRSADW